MRLEGHSHCFMHFLASKHNLGDFGAPPLMNQGYGATGLGAHLYENVLQDFWGMYPYLASRCIVVFHDAAMLPVSSAIQHLRSAVGEEFTFCKWHGAFYRNIAGTQMMYRGYDDAAAAKICRPRRRGVDSLLF